jgi:glycosyltransferase involved in cell wall biosynthesis
VIRILLDGRLRGHDGIGRYTACLSAVLRAHPDPHVRIHVLEPTGTPRYSLAEGAEVLRAADAFGADVVHMFDYRIPIDPARIPVIATVHDVLRLDPQHCYDDERFTARFGAAGYAHLQAAVDTLRQNSGTDDAIGGHLSAHAEFYTRMLAWTGSRCRGIVTPTRAVAEQLAARVALNGVLTTSSWGIDHPDVDRAAATPPAAVPVRGRYLVFVGQVRAHKNLDVLLAAYRSSNALREGVRLVCVGRDFAPGAPGQLLLHEVLGKHAVAVGVLPDPALQGVYAAAEALVHLAAHEGFGFTPLEAMAAGTRVIASDIPVLRETLGAYATFVEPTSPRDAARAIDRVLAEPDSSRARSARIRWAGRYRWRRHADEVLDLYRECAR